VPLRELLEELFATIADRQRKIGTVLNFEVENRILVVGSQTLQFIHLKNLNLVGQCGNRSRSAERGAALLAFAYRT